MKKLLILMGICALLFSCSTKESRKKSIKKQLLNNRQELQSGCPNNNNIEKDIQWTKLFLKAIIPDVSWIDKQFRSRDYENPQLLTSKIFAVLEKKHKSLFRDLKINYGFGDEQILDSVMGLDGIMITSDGSGGNYFMTGCNSSYQKDGVSIYAINDKRCVTLGISTHSASPYVQMNIFAMKKAYNNVCDFIDSLGADSLKISYAEFCWAVIAQEIWHVKNPNGGEWGGEKPSLCSGKEFYLLFRIIDIMIWVDQGHPDGNVNNVEYNQLTLNYFNAYVAKGGSIGNFDHSTVYDDMIGYSKLPQSEMFDILLSKTTDKAKLYVSKSLERNPKFLRELLEYCKNN